MKVTKKMAIAALKEFNAKATLVFNEKTTHITAPNQHHWGDGRHYITVNVGMHHWVEVIATIKKLPDSVRCSDVGDPCNGHSDAWDDSCEFWV